MSGTGGSVFVDPSLTLVAQTIDTNPSNVVWVCSGTGNTSGDRVVQTLPAINYDSTTRATAVKVTLTAGITNVKFHTFNIMNVADFGNGITDEGLFYSDQTATSTNFSDAYLYNCEVAAFPMDADGWSLNIQVDDNSGVNINDTLTGATSTSTATVVGKYSTTRILVTNLLAAGTTDVDPVASWTDFIGAILTGRTFK